MTIEVIEPNGSHFLWDLIGEIKTAYGNLGKIVIQTYNQALSEGFTPEGAKNFILRNSGLSKASVYRTIPREAINPNLGRPSNFSIEKVEQGQGQERRDPEEISPGVIGIDVDYLNRTFTKEGEFNALKESILTFGQIYPIIVNKGGDIIDGLIRYKACLELGIKPWIEVREFKDAHHELQFRVNANLRRLHLHEWLKINLGFIEQQLLGGIPSDEKESKKVRKEMCLRLGIKPSTLFKALHLIDYFSKNGRTVLCEDKTHGNNIYVKLDK